jgi:hypothetical protein
VLTTYEWEVRFTLVSVHALGCVEKVKVSSVVPPKSHFLVNLDISSSKLNLEYSNLNLEVGFWWDPACISRGVARSRNILDSGSKSFSGFHTDLIWDFGLALNHLPYRAKEVWISI